MIEQIATKSSIVNSDDFSGQLTMSGTITSSPVFMYLILGGIASIIDSKIAQFLFLVSDESDLARTVLLFLLVPAFCSR